MRSPRSARGIIQKQIISNRSKGFTLIELLVVIGILAVLLAITLIAINPARQFSQANNTKRASDINAILNLNAVGQYSADNNGNITAIIPVGSASAKVIGSDTVAGKVNFYPNVAPTYIAQIPYDPISGDSAILSTNPQQTVE